jgi:hypothetical protein
MYNKSTGKKYFKIILRDMFKVLTIYLKKKKRMLDLELVGVLPS